MSTEELIANMSTPEKAIYDDIPDSDDQHTYVRSLADHSDIGFIHSTKKMRVLHFKSEIIDNQIEEMSGQMSMEDYSTIARDLDEEKSDPMALSLGGMRFCLKVLLKKQAPTGMMKTVCFDLNTCGIDQFGVASNEITKDQVEQLDKNFKNCIIDALEENNVFSRKFLLFTMMRRTEVFCTVVVLTGVQKKMKFLHFGTGEMGYVRLYTRKIFNMLKLFSELKGYKSKMPSFEQAISRFVELQCPKRGDNAFYVLHVVREILEIAEGDFTNYTLDKKLDNIGKDMVTIETGAAKIRSVVKKELDDEVNFSSVEQYKLLTYRRRMYVLNYEEEKQKRHQESNGMDGEEMQAMTGEEPIGTTPRRKRGRRLNLKSVFPESDNEESSDDIENKEVVENRRCRPPRSAKLIANNRIRANANKDHKAEEELFSKK